MRTTKEIEIEIKKIQKRLRTKDDFFDRPINKMKGELENEFVSLEKKTGTNPRPSTKVAGRN
jgi:hypothetical protein